MQSSQRILCFFGLLAPVWMILGVSYSATLYPGYSHVAQAMSELHATGSPIETIAPFINHYPLFILFAGFGYFVTTFFDSRAARLSGLLIVLHGVATLSAGYFPCDIGCNPDSTSTTQVLHGMSGLAILLTLLLAPAIWGFIAQRELQMRWFGWFSISVVLAQLLMIIPILNAAATGDNFGLYQRLSYSIPLSWLFVFSIVLLRRDSEAHR
ncbi:Uncharacterised protein [Halioglobus japonicus]|nr:Uncharacterised protein [Halioglobus japonicus]